MTYRKTRLWAAFLGGPILGVLLGAVSCRAQENDPGLLRTLQIDSATVENAYYLQAAFNNDTSAGHGLYLYGQGQVVFAKDWGVYFDFPWLVTRQPLGQVPLALGPIGLYLRYEAYHFGGWNDEVAGAFSLQAGGAYGFPNTSFPFIGSSWTVEGLGGLRWGRFFLQEECGFQGALDANGSGDWEANTGLGFRITREWYLQYEADLSAITSGRSSWTFIPQIAFQPGDWLFEFGESFGDSPFVYTQLMVARAL